MWKIGPECAAQQAKCAPASAMNCGVRNACAAVHSVCGASLLSAAASSALFGAGRTRKLAGISSAQAAMPITSIAVRQSYAVISALADGAIVTGATPMPADTSATARLRCCAIQALATAIIGA